MFYDPTHQHRQSIRFRDNDYTDAGYYFVTIRIHDPEIRLSEIVDTQVILTAPGHIVEREWVALSARFSHLLLDEHVIMPDHFHGIVRIEGQRLAKPLQPTSVPRIIQAFKSRTTNAYICGVNTLGWSPFDRYVWQRNYFERIIRDAAELDATRAYIRNNPQRFHPNRLEVTSL